MEYLLTTDQLIPSALTHHTACDANCAADLRKVKAPVPLALMVFFSLTLIGQAGDLPFSCSLILLRGRPEGGYNDISFDDRKIGLVLPDM